MFLFPLPPPLLTMTLQNWQIGFCSVCLQFLCKVCCDYHKRARHLHSHKIFTLGEEVAKEELFATIKPSEPTCSLHDQNKLRFYWETCTCSVVAHKNHKCVELSSIAQLCRDQINSLISSANDIMPKLARAIDTNIKVFEEAFTGQGKFTILKFSVFYMLGRSQF